MRLGIIGSGMIVREFMPFFVNMEGMEVAGIMGAKGRLTHPKELADEYSIPCVTDDINDFVTQGIDTVYVATPNAMHYHSCRDAMERGLNVITEKPMTSNYREAKELADLAKEKGLFYFEAITTLYYKNYRKIGEWIDRIGDIKLVQSQYTQYSSRYDRFKSGDIAPAFDPEKSGGALMDLSLYNLHYVLGLFGRPDNVQYFANVERGIDTSGVVFLDYTDFKAMCVGAKDCSGMVGGVIQGDKGTIRSFGPPGIVGKIRLELNDGTIEEYDEDGLSPEGVPSERVIPEFNVFISRINSGDTEYCYRQLEKSLLVCEVQTLARKSGGIVFPSDEE